VSSGQAGIFLRLLFAQTLDRNPKLRVQAFNHPKSQRAPAAEDLVYPILATDHRLEVFNRQTRLFHPELDRIDGVVLLVCADEADVHDPIGVVDPRDDAIFVSADIEDRGLTSLSSYHAFFRALGVLLFDVEFG
jgi:hypothetical protein